MREQLRRHLEALGVEAAAAPATGRTSSSPLLPFGDASSSLSCTSASELQIDPQQQPAAQQRLQPGSEPPVFASPHPSDFSSQASFGPQSTFHAEQSVLLQRLKAAEDERDCLRAQVSELKAMDTDMVRIVVQVSEVSLMVQVLEAPVAPSSTAQQVHSEAAAAPCQPHALCTSQSAQTSPPLASRPAAAAAAASHGSQHQQPSPVQLGNLDWVMSGLPFAAGSSRDVAHAAVAQFATERLSMADAAQSITVLRVSHHSGGLAVIRLADRAVERALCSAKARLPLDCRVSIFRSLPPEQRGAAALLRQARRVERFLRPEDVAAARRAAKAALDFARSRTVDERRSPSHRAFRPPPAAVPLGVPSYFSILHDESASVALPDADTLAEGTTPPSATAAANPTTSIADARIDVC